MAKKMAAAFKKTADDTYTYFDERGKSLYLVRLEKDGLTEACAEMLVESYKKQARLEKEVERREVFSIDYAAGDDDNDDDDYGDDRDALFASSDFDPQEMFEREADYIAKQERKKLGLAKWNALTEKQKEVFWKIKVEGKTEREVAAELNVNHKTIHECLVGAILKLNKN